MNVPGSLKHSADSADTAATAELEVSARHGDGGACGDDGDSDGAGGEDSDRCDSPGYLPRHSEVADGSQLVHMEPDNDPVQEEPAQSPQSSPEPSPRFKQSIKSIYQDIHKTQLLTCLYIMSRV